MLHPQRAANCNLASCLHHFKRIISAFKRMETTTCTCLSIEIEMRCRLTTSGYNEHENNLEFKGVNQMDSCSFFHV